MSFYSSLNDNSVFRKFSYVGGKPRMKKIVRIGGGYVRNNWFSLKHTEYIFALLGLLILRTLSSNLLQWVQGGILYLQAVFPARSLCL